MNSVQPWMVAVGTLAGLAVGAAAVSGWWWPQLKRARRLIDRIESSRLLLNEQTTQARRQIERQQMELGEMRLTVERLRRKLAAAAPHESGYGSNDSMLPLDSVSPVSAPTPLPAFRPVEKPRAAPVPAPAPTIASVDAALARNDRAHGRADGFARTEIQDDNASDDPHSRGFMPTQLDKPF
ncbi:hypothetical protein [Mitsuaria sp. 7]|uniref:hypothetical protein n=1 Tax=Mitsuaria sp. 7 TaxID=1658665 RepID=UPI0007DCCA8B|nr:hypothetical protein [Mitsuaria sp. 7]ANH68500.1 hypothetical protein ABE85_14655 [Mitsuaria sp. 7]